MKPATGPVTPCFPSAQAASGIHRENQFRQAPRAGGEKLLVTTHVAGDQNPRLRPGTLRPRKHPILITRPTHYRHAPGDRCEPDDSVAPRADHPKRRSDQAFGRTTQKIIRTAIREVRMPNIRLYRISKEMCPHHPKPPASSGQPPTITIILEVFFNKFTVASQNETVKPGRPTDNTAEARASIAMSYDDIAKEDYRWVTLLATGSNAERANIFTLGPDQEKTAVFTSIAQQSSSKPVSLPTPDAGVGRRRSN